MTTAIASLLKRKGSVRPASPAYRHDLLAAFDRDGALLCVFPAGTSLGIAVASAKHNDTQSAEDLQALLALERAAT